MEKDKKIAMKNYRLEHLDETKKYNKDYHDKHKVNKLQYMAEKIYCDCGCEITRSHMSRHKLTAKHNKIINNFIHNIEVQEWEDMEAVAMADLLKRLSEYKDEDFDETN